MSYEMYRQQFEGESFNDLMVDVMKGTPWVILSVLLHGVLGLILWLFSGNEEPKKVPPQAEARLDDEPIEEEEEEEEEPEEEEPEPEELVEDPVEVDEEVDDHDEDETNEEYEEVRGEEDEINDKPMDASSNNDAIGLGGGAGGKFGGRRGGRKRARKGRGRRGQQAVDKGLEWLANHQSKDGSWDCDEFMKNGDAAKGPLCDGKGGALYDVGVSGLALLAFLGAGETHRSGTYKKTVRDGLKWLKDQQDGEGCFGPQTTSQFTYNHSIATLAMCEAYGLTKSPLFLEPAKKGVQFVLQCQNPYKAWRYGIANGDNDTSVTGWMVMALKSAKMAGIPVDDAPMEWALSWVEDMTDEDTGRTGYNTRGGLPVRETGKTEEFPAAEVESLTAVGMLCRVFAGQNPEEHKMVKAGSDLLIEKLPQWDESKGSIDMYYWYYGTLAMFQVSGPRWDTWNKAMEAAVVETQRGAKEGAKADNFTGSWDPKGAWGENGGRVYSTAIMTLCLEVYYRYGRVFGAK
ncbi:MAG: prenyltransferase/squalene oxidase repeat-containing protein [Planctomycetota bacterium]